MVTKSDLKDYSSLLNKKGRKVNGKFIVEGAKLILEALNSGFRCELVMHTSAFEQLNSEILLKLKKLINRIECIKKPDFDKLSDTVSPQEVIGIFYLPHEKEYTGNNKLIAALETINDPGNMGTIIRNCDWFGIKTVLINDGCAEIFSPKVIRSSAGSVFHINIIEQRNMLDSLAEMKKKNYKIVCADLDGENLNNYKCDSKTIIVLANEANGPSCEILKLADRKITIPRKGKAESLNVANASAVLLYELTKQE